MERREFITNALAAFSTHSLLKGILQADAIRKNKLSSFDHWVARLDEYCQDLKKEKVTPAEWQHLTEKLFLSTDLQEIVQFIDLKALQNGFDFPDLGVNTRYVKFPEMDGLPEKTSFVKKIFGMSKDRAIIPHGHSNMASMHLVLEGQMHLRQYDKIEQKGNSLIIRPTVDKKVTPGEASSISDDHDNIHWFIAESIHAFTLDIIVLDLNNAPYDIHNLDMDKKIKHGDGTLEVPEISVDQALSDYGKVHHY